MNRVRAHGNRSIFFIFCFLLIVGLLTPDLETISASDRRQKSEEAKVSTGKSCNKEEGMADIDKLTEEEGRTLLKVARQTIEQELFARKDQNPPPSANSSKFSEKRGTFVTLTIQGGLRGCIGHIIPQESLIEGIRVNAINAAFRDPRFRPLTKDEWKRVRIEISILTDPKPLSYSDVNDLLDKLRPGIDGVILKKGFHQSTFLPQVWEQLPGKEEFLTHLSLKAGLDGDEWRKGDLEILTYQVQAFEE
jgi:AmmeMemoRadiSam system protein A